MMDDFGYHDVGCATCGYTVGMLRDDISEREFEISGMCQACQDETFDVEDWSELLGEEYGGEDD